MRFNKIEDVYKVFDELVEKWDLNENGEKDGSSIANNYLLNTVSAHYNLKHRGYTNKCEMVTGSFLVDSHPEKLLH